MSKPLKKRFDLQVTSANSSVSKTFELDKTIKAIKGVLFTSNRDDLMYMRGSQRLEINGQEFFPENYETKLLMSGINVRPNHRYFDLGGIPPGNGVIKVDFKDEDDGRTVFAAYRVTLYVDCETE